MRCLVVLAHPLPQSLNASLAKRACETLASAGHDLRFLDLYQEGFDPVLSADARADYYSRSFDDAAGLSDIEVLVLVFPTWWFGLPAILKGWIDRSFLPGVAYDHAKDLSALTPRLTHMRHVVAITTLGAPAWIDRLILRRPVFRALKWGLVRACSPKARFHMLSLYAAETVTPDRADAFGRRVTRLLEKLR